MLVATTRTSLRVRRVLAFARLVRAGNLLMLGSVVLLGAILADGPAAVGPGSLGNTLLVILSAILVAGSGNALNDVFDHQIDLANRPDRPIPSGLLSKRVGWATWAVGSLLGLLLALAVSVEHLGFAAACAGILYLYSDRLKAMPLVGNLAIALLGGLVVVYGALEAGVSAAVWAAAAFAFSTTLAREIIKDVQDVEGDASAGLRTVPIVWGEKVAILVAVSVLLLTVLASPLPFLFMRYGGIYLLAVLVTDAILLRTVWILLERGDDFAARASILTKWGMMIGIIALALYWAG